MLATDVPAIEKFWADDITVNWPPNNQILKGKKDAIELGSEEAPPPRLFVVQPRRGGGPMMLGDTVILMGQETVMPKGDAPSRVRT